jgi:hypothetical protein
VRVRVRILGGAFVFATTLAGCAAILGIGDRPVEEDSFRERDGGPLDAADEGVLDGQADGDNETDADTDDGSDESPDAGDTPPEGGAPCAKNADCDAGYCYATGCSGAATGTCGGKTVSSKNNPVCGCDTVTYWNASLAAKKNVSVAFAGPCKTVPSGGIGITPCTTSCANGGSCNNGVSGSGACAGASGACWGMPVTCPSETHAYLPCAGGACAGLCSSIKSGAPYYLNPGGCP